MHRTNCQEKVFGHFHIVSFGIARNSNCGEGRGLKTTGKSGSQAKSWSQSCWEL